MLFCRLHLTMRVHHLRHLHRTVRHHHQMMHHLPNAARPIAAVAPCNPQSLLTWKEPDSFLLTRRMASFSTSPALARPSKYLGLPWERRMPSWLCREATAWSTTEKNCSATTLRNRYHNIPTDSRLWLSTTSRRTAATATGSLTRVTESSHPCVFGLTPITTASANRKSCTRFPRWACFRSALTTTSPCGGISMAISSAIGPK